MNTVDASNNSLRSLLKLFWHNKFIIVCITVVCALLALIYALSQPNQYKSTALVKHVKTDGSQMGQMSGIGQLVGMAGLGLGIGGAGDEKLADIAALESVDFLSRMVGKDEVLIPLFAAKEFDIVNRTLTLDPTIYDEQAHRWVRQVNPPFKPKPSHLEAVERFREHLTVEVDRLSGLIQISMTFYSPELTKAWLDNLIASFNDYVRKDDVQKYEEHLAYLQGKVQDVQNSEHRNILFSLIEQEQQKAMLAHISEEYVFKVVETPIMPEKKHSPKRALILAIGIVIGFLLSIFVVIVRVLLRD